MVRAGAISPGLPSQVMSVLHAGLASHLLALPPGREFLTSAGFAGTGALGLEAISRGAVGATFIERHIPTSKVVQENIDHLGLGDLTELFTVNTFLWAKRDLGALADRVTTPWVIF